MTAEHQRLQWRAAARFPWHWQSAQVAGAAIALAVPSDPDQVLLHSCQRQPVDDAELVDPFWAQVWSATSGLDRFLDQHPCFQQRRLLAPRVLELGCGTGLAGIAALLRGAAVTFTDGVSDPLLLVRITLGRLRSVPPERSQVRRLRFGIDRLDEPPFPLILGSDITYQRAHWPRLLQTLQTHLGAGGEVLLSDPYRSVTNEFVPLAEREGWRVEVHAVTSEPPGTRVLRLTRRV